MPRTTGQKVAIAIPALLAACSFWIVLDDWLGEGAFRISYAIIFVFALVMMVQRIRDTRE